jgi:hypothetical protein
MKPAIDYEKKTSTFSANTSKSDLIDELSNKFGSKVSHRVLEQRKKNQLCLKGREDIGLDVNSMVLNKNENEPNPEAIVQNEENGKAFEDILPPQKENCLSVKEVYNIEDVINTKIAALIKTFSKNKQPNDIIKSEYLKGVVKNSWNNMNERIIAIYLDVLSRLYQLKASQMNKNNPIPDLEDEEMQTAFMDTYTQSSLVKSKIRRVMGVKFKDKMTVHAIILMIILNNFKPVEINHLTELLKTSFVKLKKLIEVVGCYIESFKNPDRTVKKTFVLKLPLNNLKESKFKRRATKNNTF